MDVAYKTRGYEVQPLIRLKMVWTGPDVSKYIFKKLVIRLKFRNKIVESKLFWLQFRNKLVLKSDVFVLVIICFDSCFMCWMSPVVQDIFPNNAFVCDLL